MAERIRKSVEDAGLPNPASRVSRRVTLSICGLGMLDETEAEPLGTIQPVPSEKPAKLASVTGEVKTRIPSWSAEQQAEVGTIFKEIHDLGAAQGEADVAMLRKTMKYDDPSSVIDAAMVLLNKWRDCADQANQGAKL